MHRRAVLAGAGIALASLAGCIGRAREEGRTIGETATFDDGTSLTVADPTVQKSIIADHSVFLGVGREEGLQFVVFDVDGDADFEPASFVLERDGDAEEPPRVQQQVRRVVRSCEGTCIAVPVAAEAVDSLAIVYRSNGEIRAVWELEDATVTALSKVPDLRLRDAAFTDRDGDVGIEVTVENVGDRDGGFRALVAPAWVADVEIPFGFTVPKAETVTETVVPSEIQWLEPDEAAFANEPTEDTRYFRVESES